MKHKIKRMLPEIREQQVVKKKQTRGRMEGMKLRISRMFNPVARGIIPVEGAETHQTGKRINKAIRNRN
jgi:hypothetical protein